MAKEHEIAFGLTDHETATLQGALQERGENVETDRETCESLEQVLLDQLGPEDGEGGWEVLRPPFDTAGSSAPTLQEQALTQIQHIAHDGALMIDASRKGDGHNPTIGEYVAALEAKVERIANIAEVGEPDEDFRAALDALDPAA